MTDINATTSAKRTRTATVRIACAFLAALAFAFGIYVLLEATRTDGLVSFSFLLILPGAICAFVSYVGDPLGERSRRFYFMTPVALLAAIIPLSIIILREGTICVVILSPLWLASGVAGSAITYVSRKRPKDGQTYCTALILLPLLAIQVEPMIILPETHGEVTRSIVVHATPAQIWPLLKGIPDVGPQEGRCNFTEDLLGVPRPLGAHMVGEGIGALRLANWGRHVRFSERITAWQPGRDIAWQFQFNNGSGWEFTDRHLVPDSHYFKVQTGGYRMERIDAERTRVTLYTRYWIKTPVNSYSKLLGQAFLGDIQNNLLALIRQRAESSRVTVPAA